jgi:hypothetical protein
MAGLVRSACLCLALIFAQGRAHGQSSADFVDAGDLRFGALPQQELANGHCSLFLWSRSERPVLILFVDDNPARATVRLQGKTRSIERKATAGERVYGHFPKQSFSGDGVSFDVDLTFDQDRPIKDGAVIKTGVLRTRTRDGSEAMTPVGGMIGCKAN